MRMRGRERSRLRDVDHRIVLVVQHQPREVGGQRRARRRVAVPDVVDPAEQPPLGARPDGPQHPGRQAEGAAESASRYSKSAAPLTVTSRETRMPLRIASAVAGVPNEWATIAS